jgi:hypothetical protein
VSIAKGEQEYTPGDRYIGSVPMIDVPDEPGDGTIRALNPKTGDHVWEYKLHTKPLGGSALDCRQARTRGQ